MTDSRADIFRKFAGVDAARAPTERLGCRVLDKDGDDETPREYDDTGYAEWKAVEVAHWLALSCPEYAPFTVTDADGVTLHTIPAPSEAK